MSLLSNFIASHVIASLESEFAKHAPDLQAEFVAEVEAFSAEVVKWVQSKLEAKSE